MIVVNAEDWLAEDGELPYDGPAGLFRNALRMAQCIEYCGQLPQLHLQLTLIPCRRRPGGTPCRGTLAVVKTERDELHAFCVGCRKDEFLISNWQDTLFAAGPPEAVPVADEAPPDASALPPTVRTDLEVALRGVGSSCDANAALRLIATAVNPSEVIEEVMSKSRLSTMASAQALASALMAAWNHTPRAELGGETPEQRYRSANTPRRAEPKVGRNEPCPCGSGTKYKKCCGAPN